MVPYYTKDSLPAPVEKMDRYHKTATTPMIAINGPCVIVTQEGEYELDENWSGFLAVDTAGYPYPIDGEEHSRTYQPES